MKSLVIQKYGGSSLATPTHIKRVAKKIALKKKDGYRLVIVGSAMGNATDELLKLSKEVSDKPSTRELDMLLSSGERISMSLLSMALHMLGVESISFTGSQSGIVTNTDHTHAKILEIKGERIKEALELDKVVIIAGFQGVSTEKEVTTLGRGGSDVTAVALAGSLGAERCEFYKDVDGLYTKDPKKHSDAKKIDRCHYETVLELVSKGDTVFQRQAVELAQKLSVALYISSTFESKQGTHIFGGP